MDLYKHLRFSRSPLYGFLYLLGAMVWLGGLSVQYFFDQEVIYLGLIVAAMMAFHGVWNLRVPYVVLTEQALKCNAGLFKRNTYRWDSIVKIEGWSHASLRLTFADGSQVKLSLRPLATGQRESFVTSLQNIAELKLAPNS